MNPGKLLLGVLAGFAAGAALGILFAPDKGTSTRRKISDTKDLYAEELGLKFNEFIDSISSQFDSVKEKASRMAENGKAKVDETVSHAKSTMS